MSNVLKLVLTDHWFEEIKSGRKTHEYRNATEFWCKRIQFRANTYNQETRVYFGTHKHEFVEFQKAYRKNPERMTFKIKNITMRDGFYTDLKVDGMVFDIELGERIDEQNNK